MLRFRRDRLYLGLEPDQVTLVRLSCGSSIRVVASTRLPFSESSSESELLLALEQALRDPQWQKARAHVVVADRLIRYFIAERPPGARNAKEVELAAGLRFEDIFGVPVDDWTIQVDMPPLAKNQLGCALRKELVSNLVAICSAANTPIVSLQPFAVSEFNRSHATIGNKEGWFAVMGRHSLWVAQKKGSDWLNVHQHLLQGDIATEFARLMSQEFLRAAVSTQPTSPTVWLSGFNGDEATRTRMTSSSTSLLGTSCWPKQSEAWSSLFRLALSPVWPACS